METLLFKQEEEIMYFTFIIFIEKKTLLYISTFTQMLLHDLFIETTMQTDACTKQNSGIGDKRQGPFPITYTATLFEVCT